MLRFEGDKTLSRPLAEVWTRLTDVRFLIECLPDVEHVKTAEADHAEFVVRPGLAFVRGNLEVNARVVEKIEPTSIRYSLLSKGIGSSSNVETVFTLTAQDEKTQVHWVAEVKELGGLLKLVPSGLIRGAAQKVIGDVWNRIEAKMIESLKSAPPPPPPPAAPGS
jgi:carbon monoxide dehydrogenase subunit G